MLIVAKQSLQTDDAKHGCLMLLSESISLSQVLSYKNTDIVQSVVILISMVMSSNPIFVSYILFSLSY